MARPVEGGCRSLDQTSRVGQLPQLAPLKRAGWPKIAAWKRPVALPLQLLLSALVLGLCLGTAQAQDVNLDTDYRNLWLNTTNLSESPYSNYFGVWPDEALTNASTAVYGGSVLDNSTNAIAVRPTGGDYGLEYSSLGQPVEGIRSDFALGDTIAAPDGADTNQPPANFVAARGGNNLAAYYQLPDGGAFWVPSTHQVIAAQPNNIEIQWIMLDGTTNTQVLNINAVPSKRPAKLFWTENPYDAPPVLLQGLFPVIHYNSQVRPPTFSVTTNVAGGVTSYTTNLASGVNLDGNKQLRATEVSGMFIVEYYQEGTYTEEVTPVGIEIVQVLAPDIQLLTANIGDRLLPQDLYWAQLEGVNGVVPNVTRGINDTVFVYGNNGPKLNWAYSIKRTDDPAVNGEQPNSAEIYWQHTGVMNVLWPFEADWYSCDWPAHPQVFILGNTSTDQAPILIPSSLNAQLMPDMDPPLHAHISNSGRTIYTTAPGTCLVQYQTADDVWFDVLRTVHSTNSAYFDLQPSEWTIGQELTPGDPEEHALQMNGTDAEATIGTSFLNHLGEWTLSLWFSAQDFRGATLYSEGTPNNAAFDIVLTTNGQISVSTRNEPTGGSWHTVTTPNAPIASNAWHYLTLVYSGGTDAAGDLEVHLDDDVFVTNGLPRVYFSGEDQAMLGTYSGPTVAHDWFLGKLDELRIWSIALDNDQISSNQFASSPFPAASALASFPCDEGQGNMINNEAGDRGGTLYGGVIWSYGQTFPDQEWLGFPGYIHLANGLPNNNRYNVNRYSYPTEANPGTNSYVFAINTGTLEVWWANQSRNTGMPPVYYPSRVVNYTNTWPTNAPEIVIASGLGSSAPELPQITLSDPSIYYQNDPSQDGYNPNEEHALLLENVAYALRNDLNQTNASSYTSHPFVLIDHLDSLTARPKMQLYHVAATNAIYSFERTLTAGFPILPPQPLASFPPATNSITDTNLPAWRDRKHTWWAASAGNDGGTADATMRFWYQVQPTFYFPALSAGNQPAVGTEVPWLPNPSSGGGTNGMPVAVTYHISWPDDVPKLHLGQTLTTPINGLPDIYDQLSVEIPYQQSKVVSSKESVVLFDPIVDQVTNLASSVIDAMVSANIARHDTTDPYVRFPNLPPSLYPRIFYDPTRGAGGQLVLEGQLEQPLTGPAYLLLNLLEPFERQQLRDAAQGIESGLQNQWVDAVNGLPGSITPISPNGPFVKAALGARLSRGAGYVTLAFNNSADESQVPSSSPVSLSIIQVDTNLYSGTLEVIEPSDVLAEQLSLRISADFAGFAEDCVYRWRYVEPVGGLIPNTNFLTYWLVYGANPTPDTNEVTISGASPFTFADHYFAVQYQPKDTSGPSGTNWSAWTYQLAPGWVVRAMTGINPFLQLYQDTIDHAIDTRGTMLSEAGGPYEGDIALNLDDAGQAGLIPTYETIFHRAKEFSLLAGISDPGLNQTLLFAAGRLHDLYMLLGNEAFADAQDPTIAFPDDLSVGSIGGQSTSIFPFMNQEPNELEEELALLRGRDDTLAPPVTTSPVYNRLIWNFTQGIDGGEAAYAYNYNITGDPTNTTGVITAEDAKRLYPQGHGDAWGQYLSAIGKYYDLLAYTNFMWQTVPGATLLGNAAVSTDFEDEQKFAETAAARARTGAQIVRDTFRERYSEDSSGAWPQYHDSNTNRAWGIAGWACRAGQAAYYDWAVVNSLMWDNLTNLTQVGGTNAPPEGIQKVDRRSTPEINDIAYNYRDIQASIDSANSGLNPLGLSPDVVPFDIDPTGIDAGETHFEQIYDRALQAVYNACLAFNHARGVSLQLNQQYSSLYDLSSTLAQSETDYHNRLTEIYGYPYSDDIGPTGHYPQGYDGPDLLDWQIIDLDNLLAVAPTGQVMTVQVYDLGFAPSSQFSSLDPEDYTKLKSDTMYSTNSVITITNLIADNGLKLKPSQWAGSRRAEGELQLAMADFVREWYSVQSKAKAYEQNLYALEVELLQRQADYKRITGSKSVTDDNDGTGEWERATNLITQAGETTRVVNGLKITAQVLDLVNKWTREIANYLAGAFPSIKEGIVGPFPEADTTISPGTGLQVASAVLGYVDALAAQSFEIGSLGRQEAQQIYDLNLQQFMTQYQYLGQLKWPTYQTEVDLQGQYVKQADLYAEVEALNQAQQRINKLLAEGEKLIFQRAQMRSRAGQRIQMNRYADISFRLYRNDALRRYQATFDLAARYVYLAAKAYDYETGLLPSDTSMTPGSRFLEDVVRARLPGRFFTWLGEPMIGGSSGDPGLADILARMNADWQVVKGRFGFNNPDTETSRFSLRSELFRVSPSSSGDATWEQVLENSKVVDLNQLPDFQRYCRPFSTSTNPEPAIVISFPTYIRSGQNYFGLDLAGGDNAYDPSHASTKIRSVGVWFTGFNNTFNTNSTGGGLANEPRVYLIPVGQDVMRSPTGDADSVRNWTVLDQAIPLPYDIGGADIDNPDWSPIADSLSEPLAQIRRFASLRAYHDSGQFVEAETHNNGRLIGRSAWNTQWMLIIPGSTLLSDPEEGIERFIHGALVNGERDGNGIKDIKLFFQTYSISGD